MSNWYRLHRKRWGCLDDALTVLTFLLFIGFLDTTNDQISGLAQMGVGTGLIGLYFFCRLIRSEVFSKDFRISDKRNPALGSFAVRSVTWAGPPIFVAGLVRVLYGS